MFRSLCVVACCMPLCLGCWDADPADERPAKPRYRSEVYGKPENWVCNPALPSDP